MVVYYVLFRLWIIQSILHFVVDVDTNTPLFILAPRGAPLRRAVTRARNDARAPRGAPLEAGCHNVCET